MKDCPDRLAFGSPSGGVTQSADGMYVILSLGKQYCAISAENVEEVLTQEPFTRFPLAGKSVAGAMFFRGACVTVYDLGWILARCPVKPSRSSRIIVLREPNRASLLVERILTLISGAGEPIDSPDLSLGRYVNGQIRWLDRLVKIIDVHGLLRLEADRAEALMRKAPGEAPRL